MLCERTRPTVPAALDFEKGDTMNLKRLAVCVSLVTSIFLIGLRSASADDRADVMAAVHRYFDNLEDAKPKTAPTMCDPQVSILDEFPPHVWHGPTA
jgi:hypothetical protein